MTKRASGNDEDVPGYQPLAETRSGRDELWSFTVGLYRYEDVESWCLAWQRDHGIDISMMLWAGWVQHMRRVALSANEIRGAIELCADWRNHVIVPVRNARKYLKSSGLEAEDPEAYAELRRHLRAAELTGERREQDTLLTYAQSVLSGDANATSSSNMHKYLAACIGELTEFDGQRVAQMDAFAAEIADERG